MGGRVVAIRETSNDHEKKWLEFETIRNEALRLEIEKRNVERIENTIQKIPMRFRNKNFQSYIAEYQSQIQIKNIAFRYVTNFKEILKQGNSLIFKGKPGTGKTLLSLIMYQELAKQGFNVRYESSLEFISEILVNKFKSEFSYQNHLKVFDDVQFLIIDEVTESINKGGMPSEIEKQVLFQLINKRYEKNLCTLIITNRNQDELITRLGLPSVDRLLEQGMSLTFDWNSYRQK